MPRVAVNTLDPTIALRLFIGIAVIESLCGFLTHLYAQSPDSLSSLIAGKPEVREVAGGFKFTEGPAANQAGDIFFTDIPKSCIHVWRSGNQSGTVEVWLEPSGNANGLFWGTDGSLYACQMGEGRRVVKIDPVTKVITPVAEKFEGKRFNAPNDLIVDASGAVWFTDPGYGRTPADTELDTEAVYWISPDRKTIRRVADGFKRPNGIAASPDGKMLYITDRDADVTFVYPILGPGMLGDRTTFAEVGCDGFAIDSRGNLYATVKEPLIRIYAPDKRVIGDIPLPVAASNITFGGADRKTLFITAKDKVYSLPMKISGGG